jgi:hypothetical protein
MRLPVYAISWREINAGKWKVSAGKCDRTLDAPLLPRFGKGGARVRVSWPSAGAPRPMGTRLMVLHKRVSKRSSGNYAVVTTMAVAGRLPCFE